MITTQELAKKVLTMMEEQQRYFEMSRKNLPEKSSQLTKCKSLEAEIKAICKEELKDKSQQEFF